MEIRRLESWDDLPGIHRVNVRAWRAAYTDILPEAVLADRSLALPPEEAKRRFDRLQTRTGVCLVATDDTDSIQGYCTLRWGDDAKSFVGDTQAGLKELYVDPDHWGRGIGSTLLETGIDDVPNWVTRLRLEMLAGNRIAETFYEERGFEQVGTSAYDIRGEEYETVIYEREL